MKQERKRDLDELSGRRKTGMRLLKEGVSQSDVASEFGVSRQTVSRWAKLMEEYPGDEPWRGRPIGRPSGLSQEQRAALIKMLADRYVDDPTEQWTLARVARLIEEKFGLSYSLPHVWAILTEVKGRKQIGTGLNSNLWERVVVQAYPELKGRIRSPGALGAEGKRRRIARMVMEVRSDRVIQQQLPS
jgi:transposase